MEEPHQQPSFQLIAGMTMWRILHNIAPVQRVAFNYAKFNIPILEQNQTDLAIQMHLPCS